MPQHVRVADHYCHIYWEPAVGRTFLPHGKRGAPLRAALVQAARQAGCVLVCYLVLPREIHLISTLPPGGTAAPIAQVVGSAVARQLNRAEGVSSPAFARSYRAEPVSSREALWEAVRLLAWRPLALGLCRAPAAYSHSSVRVCLGYATQAGFDVRAALATLSDAADRRAEFRVRIGEPVSPELQRAWEASHALGATAVRTAVARSRVSAARATDAKMILAAGGGTLPGAIALLTQWLRMQIDRCGDPALHRSPRRSEALVRAVLACLATNLGLCSAAFLARQFGVSKSTLSEQMQRCRKLAREHGRAHGGTVDLHALLHAPARQIIAELHRRSAAAGAAD